MASTCPLCDERFATDELLRQHRPKCTYPKKGKEPLPRNKRKK
jgi:hypothetical protein